ncbi:MAG: hypothetical protein MUD12_09355 [Spirochaetes bacterium]|jgi:hypothetical protein|nr:hypothetical protein [Spirochaetota bacterium]
MLKKVIRYLALSLIIILIALPGISFRIFRMSSGEMKLRLFPYIYSVLPGVTLKNKKPELNIANWASGEYQKEYEKYWGDVFGFRGFLIKFINQIYYSFFNKSYMNDQSIIIGKNNQLYEKGYINEYTINTELMSDESLDALAGDIRTVQKKFNSRGIGFMVLITPNKAYTYPEFIPDQFKRKNHGIRNYDRIMKKLHDSGVSYLDAQDLLLKKKDRLQVPLFSRGGIHWNELGLYYVLNPLMEIIGKNTGKNTARISCRNISFAYPREMIDSECDLLDLLCLLNPDRRYPVPRLDLVNTEPNCFRPDIAFVGGSFCTMLIETLFRDKIYAARSATHYWYFKIFKIDYPSRNKIDIDTAKFDWKKEFLGRDLVVLEINECNFSGKHIRMFIDEAFKNLN